MLGRISIPAAMLLCLFGALLCVAMLIGARLIIGAPSSYVPPTLAEVECRHDVHCAPAVP